MFFLFVCLFVLFGMRFLLSYIFGSYLILGSLLGNRLSFL